MTIFAENVMLLVVDMQNGFLGEKSRHITPSVVSLVEAFRSRGLPIVFTRFHNKPQSQYERLIGWSRLRTSPEIDLTPQLDQVADSVIDKTTYSAFTPEFSDMIAKQRWQTIAICGVATDGCVLKTAVDAFERDLIPIVVHDACASHAGQDIHEAGLTLLRRFIGKNQIVDTHTLLSRIDERHTSAEP
jgi:nicotinamidase-related amidase